MSTLDTDVDLADELERLIEQDAVWETAELRRGVGRIAVVPGPPAAALARCLTFLADRLEEGPCPEEVRRDVEGLVYPRVWKLLEAVRDGLPESEQLIRIRALEERLTRLLVRPPPPPR